ncbi:MAG: hypothetical protein KDA99_03885, partial [Planctomycetales bacterium]|nr:hypothetical protein [Planctomycetales bacterium]
MRLPIVGYDLPEHRRSAGGASLYAKPGDELDLARCLEQLMDDPALRARMGKAGRLRIEEQLAWDYQKHHLLETYRKLRNESASADVRSPVST